MLESTNTRDLDDLTSLYETRHVALFFFTFSMIDDYL